MELANRLEKGSSISRKNPIFRVLSPKNTENENISWKQFLVSLCLSENQTKETISIFYLIHVLYFLVSKFMGGLKWPWLGILALGSLWEQSGF